MNVEGVDSVVRAVLEKFVARSRFGREKYGTDLDRTDLGVGDWITHAQEELMDGILYLEKLRKSIASPVLTPSVGGVNPTVSSSEGGMGGALAPPKFEESDAPPYTYTT